MGESLDTWDQYLRDMSHRCRSWSVDPIGTPRAFCKSDMGLAILEILRRGQEEGLSLVPSLAALRREMQQAHVLLDEADKVRRLVVLRAFLSSAIVWALRVWALPEMPLVADVPSSVDWLMRDLQAVILGVSLLMIGSLVYLYFLPTPWLWQKGLSKNAPSWLTTHLFGVWSEMDPWAERVRELERETSALGIGMMGELRHLLRDWSDEENQRVAGRLKQLEEFLPLWEMVTLGLAVTLFLMVPLSRGWAGFG